LEGLIVAKFVEVTLFELTVGGAPIDTVGNMMFLTLRVEYAGGLGGIHAGDIIQIEIDNAANDILKFVGFGHTVINIYGDGLIGKVGTRTYRNDTNGNYYLEVLFDDGYNNYFGGDQPDNITGWLESSVYIEYKKEVIPPGTNRDIEIYINGVKIPKNVIVNPGGGTGPEPIDYPGSIVAKSWRYGDHSGNLWDAPEYPDNDISNFDLMRWNLLVGYQNLTWRDLRGSGGESYFTTPTSLQYSNNNPTGARYQSANEPYLEPYANQSGYPIDSPYLYYNVEVDDYLAIGLHNGVICSAHDYLRESLRIIRVLGREENNSWWGKGAFRVLADSNFLVPAPDEPIDRYLTELLFKGYRGLTIDEFLAQMHREGQLLDKHSADDILVFDYVANSEAPFSDPTDTNKIAHFNLQLGDFYFDDTNAVVDLVGADNSTMFSNVPAKNLPYAYWIYYDTEAKEAILDGDYFYYVNAATFRYSGQKTSIDNTSLWVKIEDASGGSGRHLELRIRKVDENNAPLQGIKFILTQVDVDPPRAREVITTINGTASFTLGLGRFTLVEEVPPGSNIKPIAPMYFTINTTDVLVNLKDLLAGTGYANYDDLDYDGSVNGIINRQSSPFVELILTGRKYAIGKPVKGGEFHFTVSEGDEVVATGVNTAEGDIIFSKITYTQPGVHVYEMKED